jgi:hypothetical protein
MPIFLPNFSAKIFKNHNIGPRWTVKKPRAIKTDPDAIADDLGRTDEVVEGGVVGGQQGAGPRRNNDILW